MGEVFLAEDTRLERQAAIKLLPAEMAADPERRDRFLREARAASALNHPHVCVVYDVGETDTGVPYIAMEYLEGQSLDLILARQSFSILEIIELTRQVADALDVAHRRGIVHRDIKPANVSRNDRGQVKVLDFGLAKRLVTDASFSGAAPTELHQTHAGQILGTPNYMSPEQALGKDVDHRTDIFSLGVMLYRLLTGEQPFQGQNLAETIDRILHAQPTAIARLNYDVPPELERITLKCLQKSADRRYQSARDLMVDLKNLARQVENAEEAGVSEGVNRFEATLSSGERSPAAETAAISVEDLRNTDVLLSYASIDDQPLLEGKLGWVSQLHRNLAVRMEQLSGERINITRLPEVSFSRQLKQELLEILPSAKAMISVVSPPFIKSDVCRQEVEQFWRSAEESGDHWVENKSRLMKVLKTAVSEDEIPPSLAHIFAPLFGFEFFELDPDSGRVREFDETFGPLLKQRFFERVYDLAYDACQVLKTLKQVRNQEARVAELNPHRQWIYLATTTSDVQDERDRIKRELLERGHVVLPDASLPMLSRDAERAVQECLEKCTIAIHLFGRHYGVTPEDSSESLPALQLRMTSEVSRIRGLQRMVWMPGGGESADERQRAFILRVQEDPVLHFQAEIIEGNLNLLKKDLIRRLAPPEEKPKPDVPPDRGSGSGSPPKIYLICDVQDEANIETLEDYLFDQGLEVSLPAFDGNDADAAALHQENLLTCDAVLVYYGSAPKAWVDIKLRELLKAVGYGRDKPISVQAVYIAPPDDRRKERFRSHQARVIHQGAAFEPIAELDEFIGQVKGARA